MPTARPITLSPLAAAATAFPLWKQWNIDLATTGAGLKSVKSVAIGIGDGKPGGKGMVFIDDLRLYRTAPSIVAPVDPGSGSIVANYKMDGDTQDSSGKNNHGEVLGDGLFDNGVVGTALAFNGTNTYVDLPIGAGISSRKDVTISSYVNVTGVNAWQR